MLFAVSGMPAAMHVAQANTGVTPSTLNLLSLFCVKAAFADARHERSARFQANDRNQWSDIYTNEAGEQMNLIRLLPSRQLRNWITSGYVCVSKEGIKTFVKQPSALSALAILFLIPWLESKQKAFIYFY